MSLSSVAFVTTLVSAVIALGLAAFVLRCNRRASVNQWLALGLFVLAIHQALFLASRLAPSEAWYMPLLRAAFGVLAALPPIWLGFGLTLGEKNGSIRTSHWLPLLPCVAFVAFGTSIPLVFARGLQLISRSGTGQLTIGLDGWGKLLFSVYLIGLVLVLVHVENLYRSATPPVRHTLRLLILGIFVALICQIVATSYTLLFGLIHPSHPFVSAAGFLGGQAMMAFALVRHRLLGSNIYVSRYVVYRSLTLVLVGGYLLFLGIAAEILPRLKIRLDFLTGTLFAVGGGAVLALLLLSETVRWKLKSFIQAHFYQHKYDYREEWMEFTCHLSHATTASAVATQTAERILTVMWVQQVAIYATGTLSGTMSLLHQIGYHHLPSALTLSSRALRVLVEAGNRLPSAGRIEDTPENRRELIRDMFSGTPVGHLVPLVALDTLVGLLVVGPEVSGKPFGVDDRDLLAAVAAQTGAMLVNARLAQDAAEGRELQVLARLSAFIAHDLKNSVGMLSLLAENALHHMHKPEFQADAIRTLTEVTTRMQKLLATLRTSNHQPAGSTTRAGLAAAVETWLHDLKAQVPPRITLETRLEPTPDVAMDPEQLRAVLVNLVVNAIDAIPGEGRITVETRLDQGCAFLVVTDTGRGMSAAFIHDRLFRPFQTTKSRGLGIGLYQCRHIVQALGGTLTVDSQERVGTRMTVRLPAVSDPQIEKQLTVGSGQLGVGTESTLTVQSIESVESQVPTRKTHRTPSAP